MPFSTRSRTATRKPRKRKFRPTKRATGRDLNALTARLKRMMPKPERKYFDVSIQTPQATTTGGTMFSLDSIPQGAGDSQRIGDQITVQSLLLRLSIQTGSGGLGYVRVVMFRWKPGSGILPPTVSNLLQTINFLSPINVEYGEQIKVIMDKTYALATGSSQLQIDKFWRRKRYVANFSGSTTGTATNSNGTFLFFITDTATGSPTFSFYSRLRFTDM
jgi:hypothetical protein